MDWKDVAGQVVKAGAPSSAGLCWGLSAALRVLIGGIVANSLGVDNTPEAVGNAIATGDPAVVSAALSKAGVGSHQIPSSIARMAEAASKQAEVINAT